MFLPSLLLLSFPYPHRSFQLKTSYNIWFLVRHFFPFSLLEKVKWLVKKKQQDGSRAWNRSQKFDLLLSSPLLIPLLPAHITLPWWGVVVKNKVNVEVPGELPIPGAVMLLYSMGVWPSPFSAVPTSMVRMGSRGHFDLCWGAQVYSLMLSLHPPLFPLQSIAKLQISCWTQEKAGLREPQQAPLPHSAGPPAACRQSVKLRCVYCVETPEQQISLSWINSFNSSFLLL